MSTTIDFGDIHIVLERSTVSDATVRRAIRNATPEAQRTDENNVFDFFITQVRECEGLPFERLTTVPALDDLQALLLYWGAIDEFLYDQISATIIRMREAPKDGEKKAVYVVPSVVTSVVEPILTPSMTTHRSR